MALNSATYATDFGGLYDRIYMEYIYAGSERVPIRRSRISLLLKSIRPHFTTPLPNEGFKLTPFKRNLFDT